MKYFLTLIGLVLVLEGLPYAAFPEAMQRWLRQVAVMPPAALRATGFMLLGLGLLLCWLTQRTTFFG